LDDANQGFIDRLNYRFLLLDCPITLKNMRLTIEVFML